MSLMLVALAVPQVWAATKVVCDGTTTNSYAPVWGAWFQSNQSNLTTQMVYPSSELSEIPNGAVIKGIKFYCTGTVPTKISGKTMQVRVGNIPVSSYYVSKSTTKGRTLLTSSDQVYNATPTVSGSEMSFTFTGNGGQCDRSWHQRRLHNPYG